MVRVVVGAVAGVGLVVTIVGLVVMAIVAAVTVHLEKVAVRDKVAPFVVTKQLSHGICLGFRSGRKFPLWMEFLDPCLLEFGVPAPGSTSVPTAIATWASATVAVSFLVPASALGG